MKINLPEIPKSVKALPYAVDRPTDLPTSLALAARQALGAEEQVSLIFVVPAQVYLRSWFGRRYVPQQALLFTAQGVLHVQDSAYPDQPAQATYLPAVDLLYARLSLLLLYGRLEFVGQVSQALTRIVVEFNTVGQFLLQPGLQQLLRLAWGQTKIELPTKMVTKQALNELDKLPLKFDNGLRLYGLKAGERLLGVVFQPGIWKGYGYFFHRQIAATTLLALTDRELIIVEEERTGQPNAYGWIFTFYPLACVMMVEIKPGETWRELHLHLTRGDGIADRQLILEPQAALAWQNLWVYRGAETVQIDEGAR